MKQYSPAIVLAVWSALWAAGVTGDGVVVVGLMAEAAAVAVHIGEELK